MASIIRKLSDQEYFFDHNFLQGQKFISRVLLIEVSIKAGINLTKLTEAAKILTKIYPLLRSTVKRDLNKDTKTPRYFVHMSKHFDEFNNLELIDLSQSSLEWIDIIEHEIQQSFDYENGPMWRIKMLKLKQQTIYKDNYAFIMTQSHSLGDGRCAYSICLEFLNILCDLLQNKSDQYDNVSEVPSLFSMEELVEQLKKNPEFKINSASNHKNFKPINLINKSFCPRDKLDSGSRFIYFCIEPNRLGKLLQKLRLSGAKARLTGLLDVLVCYAYMQTWKRHGLDDVPLEHIQFTHAVSARAKLGVTDTQMGHFTRGIAMLMSCDELNEPNFWQLAEKDSLLLHQKIADNEEFSGMNDNSKTLNRFDGRRHFLLSNVGILKNTKNQPLIKIIQHYRFVGGVFCGISFSTVDSNLCIAINYSEKCLSAQFIDDFKSLFLEQVDLIIHYD